MAFRKNSEILWKLSFAYLKSLNRTFSICSKKYNQLKQHISFNDTRLQKHLNFLKTLSVLESKNESDLIKNYGFTFEALKYLQENLKRIEVLSNDIQEVDLLIADSKHEEKEMHDEAIKLKKEIIGNLNALQDEILQVVVPVHFVDDCDIVMELSAGVGGQEAMLFTKDLFKMYCNFANFKGWNYEVIKYDDTGIGGLRSAHLAVSGLGAFKTFKFESGVHRVQRIPKTEKAGRVHTSTMTVAVLPQPSEIDIVILPQDIEMEFKRSSGAGGQHVNTTDSCVRIKHKATGIVTECQTQRNQHQNRAMALKALRAQLYERELEAVTKETTSSRKLQIGRAGRSEKIRTYNFVQDRITDHRAHVTVHGIEALLEGGAELERLSNMIDEWNNIQMLYHVLEQYDCK